MVEVTIEKNLSYCQFKELIPDLVSIYQRAYENLPEYRDDSYCKIAAYFSWLWKEILRVFSSFEEINQ